MEIRRGDIFLVSLDPVKGSEQGKTRPCLIIQNNEGNKYSPTTIIAPLTTKHFEKEYPTNVRVSPEDSGLPEESTVLLNQIKTIDKTRIIRKLGRLNDLLMKKANLAIKISLDMTDN